MTTVLPGDCARIASTIRKPGCPGMTSAGKGVCREHVARHAAAMSLLCGRCSG